MDLKFELLKNMRLLFYKYVTVFLKPRLKNTIQWKNYFQNSKKNHFR